MTKTDFFRVLIKVFGLYSILMALLSVLPGNISMVLSYPELWGVVWLLIVIAIVFGLFFLLISKPDVIIRMLKLDKGFDEDRIQLENLDGNSIIKLSCLIIGGLLIIDNIPAFLSHTLFAFKSSLGGEDSFGLDDNIYWATSFLKLVVGYLLVTNYQMISRFFKEKSA